jgi:hypothetical protein
MVRLLSRRRSQIILIEYSHKGAAEQPIPQYVQDYVYQQWEHLKKLEAHGEALNREIESLRFQLQVQTVAFANQYPTLCGSVPAHMQADRARSGVRSAAGCSCRPPSTGCSVCSATSTGACSAAAAREYHHANAQSWGLLPLPRSCHLAL